MTAHVAPTPLTTANRDLKLRADVAAKVAAVHADAVDQQGRFPTETFAALRAERLMSVLVPTHLGGEGASISDVVDICYILGRSCAASGMVFAMHQIMVAILVRHAQNSPWHARLLRRLADEQLLIASSTTDGIGGGNVRASTCAVEQTGSRIALEKNAAVISYITEADAVLTTARRAPDASRSDQVLVALAKEDYRIEPTGSGWDTLGMRGTCSAGVMLKGTGDAEQVIPVPYEKIHAHSMMPVAHLTWSGVWSGIAAGAVDRARQFTRNAARRAGGQMPPGAAHLTRATASLRALRGMIASLLNRFESIAADEAALESMEFQTAMNLLKVNSSEQAIAVVMSAMQACGLSGYRNSGDFSISRQLRDVLSSSIMINNDRIMADAASALLLVEVPPRLRD